VSNQSSKREEEIYRGNAEGMGHPEAFGLGTRTGDVAINDSDDLAIG
jgi:hypothetical protein